MMNWLEWQQYASDEKNWLNHEEPGLLKAEVVHDFVLQLWLEEEGDVTIYELDFWPLFVENNPGGVFAPLRDPERFRLVEGDYALFGLIQKRGSMMKRPLILRQNASVFSVSGMGVN
jgi:hypothetical protein